MGEQSAIEYGQRAENLINRQQWKLAINELDLAISINPKFIWAYYGRGFCKYKLGEDKEALSDIDMALLLGGDDLETNFLRASLLSMLNRHSESIKAYSKAINFNPTDGNLYLGRGVAKCQNVPPDFKGAKNDFEKAKSLGEVQAVHWLENVLPKLDNNAS